MRLTPGYQSHPRRRAEREYDPGMQRAGSAGEAPPNMGPAEGAQGNSTGARGSRAERAAQRDCPDWGAQPRASVANLAVFCLHFTRAFAMDLAAPRQTFGLSAGLVCASLPAVTFPAFVQLASVLFGKLLHPLRCGRPFLPAYERAALS